MPSFAPSIAARIMTPSSTLVLAVGRLHHRALRLVNLDLGCCKPPECLVIDRVVQRILSLLFLCGLRGLPTQSQRVAEIAREQMQWLARYPDKDLQPMSEMRLVHAPKPLVDRRVAVREHDHARLRFAVQDLVEGRCLHLAEQCADVEALRVGEAAEVGPMAVFRPVLECRVDELVHASLPRVGEEQVASQPAGPEVLQHCKARPGQLRMLSGARLDQPLVYLVHIRPDCWVVELGTWVVERHSIVRLPSDLACLHR